MLRSLRFLLSLVAAVAMLSTWPSAQSPSGDVTLAVSGRTNQAPGVAASGSLVAVVWGASLAGKGDIFSAVSRDGGRTFEAPVRVNAVVGEARINGEVAPRVAMVQRVGPSDPEIAVLWNARDTVSQIKVARSRDGGRTYGTPIALQTSGATGDRGWQSLALDAQGTAHAIWLDHRGMAPRAASTTAKPMDHSQHQGEHDGVAMAQRSGVYYASTTGTSAIERELFKGPCYCCKTALAVGPDGSLYAAWRHVFAGNFRDMAFTTSRDGGKTFSPLVRVHEDGWAINGCPDDGPAMAVDGRGTVHLVWPTVSGGTEGTLHYAPSRDGKSFAAPLRVPTLGGPKPSHPQVAIDGHGKVVVAWDEVRNGVRGAAFSRLDTAKGSAGFGPIQVLGSGTSSYPVLAAGPKGLVAVWTSGAPDKATISVRLFN